MDLKEVNNNDYETLKNNFRELINHLENYSIKDYERKNKDNISQLKQMNLDKEDIENDILKLNQNIQISKNKKNNNYKNIGKHCLILTLSFIFGYLAVLAGIRFPITVMPNQAYIISMVLFSCSGIFMATTSICKNISVVIRKMKTIKNDSLKLEIKKQKSENLEQSILNKIEELKDNQNEVDEIFNNLYELSKELENYENNPTKIENNNYASIDIQKYKERIIDYRQQAFTYESDFTKENFADNDEQKRYVNVYKH